MEVSNPSFAPLVSIVIPTYNREQWIGEAIESAQQQDYVNLEIIVNDDCSTDNSDGLIGKYLHDPRIKYFKNDKNIGLIANFNKLFFELAEGDYVTLVGSDDYLVNKEFITKAVNVINRYENIALVFGKTNKFLESSSEVVNVSTRSRFDIEFRKGKEVFLDFADNPYYSSGAVLYSMKHLKENAIYFTGRLTTDIEMNLQLMMIGNVGYINELIYTVRQHSNNASNTFFDINQLENSYLTLVKFLRDKAALLISNKKVLDRWYQKVIIRNILMCIYMVIQKGNYKQLSLFHQLLITKYPKEYSKIIIRHPRYWMKLLFEQIKGIR